MRFFIPGGLGDNIALTAFVRAYHKYNPDEIIVPATRLQGELFRHNPNVGTGRFESGVCYTLHPLLDENYGNLPESYAKQVRVPIVDTTPEIFLTEEEVAEAKHKLLGHFGYKTIVACDPWATWPSRRWPLRHYADLVEMMKGSGIAVLELGKPQPHPTDVIQALGGPDEDQASWRIDATFSLWGQLELRQTAAVLALCDLFVGNDSGLFHMAAAVGTPQVVFFSVKPWYCRAYWNTVPLHAQRLCLATCKQKCSSPKFCLKDVSPEMAFDAVKLALSRRYTRRYAGGDP